MMARRFLRRLTGDKRGAVAVEFAFVAPMLILMYFGIAEFTDGMIVKRRVSHVASTVADLTSRVATVSSTDTGDIFEVGRTIINPLSTAPLRMRLTSISANSSGVARVDWSDASNWTTFTVNQTMTVPSGVISANQSIIRADVEYTYDSPVHYLVPTGLVMSQTYYLRPRISTSVTHS
jgi:Flp pilus assembly protein TadG